MIPPAAPSSARVQAPTVKPGRAGESPSTTPASIRSHPSRIESLLNSPTTADLLLASPSPAELARGEYSPQNPRQSDGQNDVGETESAPSPPGQITARLHDNKLFTESTLTGGSRQLLQTEYVYDRTSGDGRFGAFDSQYASDSFAPDKGKIEFGGGLGDDVRYDKVLRQNSSEKINKVNVGESSRTYGGLVRNLPHWETGGQAGNENLGASYDVSAGLNATANGETSFDSSSVSVGVKAEVTVGVRANVEGHWNPAGGPVALSGSGEATAGASANGSASIKVDLKTGLTSEVGGEVFAGGELNGSFDTGIGDAASVGAGGSLKAGIGAEFNADVDFNLDNIGGEFNIGATLGIGADVNVDLSVSPTGVVDDIKDITSGVRGWFG